MRVHKRPASPGSEYRVPACGLTGGVSVLARHDPGFGASQLAPPQSLETQNPALIQSSPVVEAIFAHSNHSRRAADEVLAPNERNERKTSPSNLLFSSVQAAGMRLS